MGKARSLIARLVDELRMEHDWHNEHTDYPCNTDPSCDICDLIREADAFMSTEGDE